MYDEQSKKFVLPKLSYAYDALSAAIDPETMEIHHQKHHQGYVDKLNAALETPGGHDGDLEKLLRDLDSVDEGARSAVRNNGGGHYNHALFWEIMGPEQGTISNDLQSALLRDLGSMEAFQKMFADAALKQFGSGWAWLALHEGSLAVYGTPNQDNPLMRGDEPVMGIDVWEHAYYLRYQNRRPDYVASWLNVINWTSVSERYSSLIK